MTFAAELSALLTKHDLHFSGTLRVIDTSDARWDLDTRCLELKDAVTHGGITDTTGPFLVATVEEKRAAPVEFRKGNRLQVVRDIAGYDCPVTGQWVGSRREHNENLKRRGCRVLEVGESRDAQKNQRRALEEGCKRTARELVAAIAHQIEI